MRSDARASSVAGAWVMAWGGRVRGMGVFLTGFVTFGYEVGEFRESMGRVRGERMK